MGPTARELVAAVAATSPVTEPDIVRRRKTLGSGRRQACSSAGVNGAASTAEVVNHIVAVCNRCAVRLASRERVDWATNEGELSIGVAKPVGHLLARDDLDSRLKDVRERSVSVAGSQGKDQPEGQR
jgi:hypothetical protein